MSYETRSIVGPESIDATDEGVIFGLAIPYNQITTIGDMAHNGFREQIAPGSTTKSLKEGDIVALNNHNSWQPLGRTSAGNLKLTNSTRGVEPELKPTNTSYAKDLAANVKAKVVRGWSFGFEVLKDDWTDDDGKPSDEYSGTNRTIREMKLIEVSPVTFPAYGDGMTNISSRDAVNAARGIETDREAKATYSDLETCGECGSTGQFSAFCTNCGEPMKQAKPSTSFCGQCGASLSDATRSVHVCETRGGNAPGDGSKPYGDVTYADPGYQDGKKRYPIDTKAHAKAAWSYINKIKNAGKYSATQLAAVKGRIRAACKKFGVTISEANAAEYAMEWRCHCKGYPIREPLSDDEKEERAKKKAAKNVKTQNASTGDDDNPDSETDNEGDPVPAKVKKAKKMNKNSGEPSGEQRKDAQASKKLSESTSKRIPQIKAILDQALSIFAKADIKSLPPELQQAVALISSANTHAGHIQNHEGLSAADSVSDADSSGRSVRDINLTQGVVAPSQVNDDNPDDFAVCEVCGYINPMDAETCEQCGDPLGNPTDRAVKTSAINKRNVKPELTTSQKNLTDDALRLAYAEAVSREIDLGI